MDYHEHLSLQIAEIKGVLGLPNQSDYEAQDRYVVILADLIRAESIVAAIPKESSKCLP